MPKGQFTPEAYSNSDKRPPGADTNTQDSGEEPTHRIGLDWIRRGQDDWTNGLDSRPSPSSPSVIESEMTGKFHLGH